MEKEALGHLGHEYAGLNLRDLSPIPAMDTLSYLVNTLAMA